MFGFQRVGDFIWAAGDSQARGFLVGGTAGRTTLAGEGLQHQDGHSQLLSTTVPNCVSYDPAFAYELAVVVQDGLRRMFTAQEDVFFYITCMNENYAHPAMPKDAQAGILKGMYLLQAGGRGKVRVNLLGSGTILREVMTAAEILERDYGVPADIFSVPSYSELRREALDVERRNLLHPDQPAEPTYVRKCIGERTGPFIAASDYMKIVPDQIRQWVPGRFIVLGTDGYGRSDSRAQLRRHFEVDAQHIVLASLRALADEGKLDVATVKSCMKKFDIDPERPNPVTQ
jgi:pyruvate dehydrogenase E1 component